jgi:hypothetical protein
VDNTVLAANQGFDSLYLAIGIKRPESPVAGSSDIIVVSNTTGRIYTFKITVENQSDE